MSLWETVWTRVRDEMPRLPTRQRSWAGFAGALIAALAILVIWFPVRLVAELLKAIDLSERPDRNREARELFRAAYALSRDLPSRSEFANSVLRHADLPRGLHDAFFEALRQLYAEEMLLEVPPIPSDLDGLDGVRWRDRLRVEIERMQGDVLVAMRRAALRAVEEAIAELPRVAGEGDHEVTAPLRTLVNPGRFVERLAGPLDRSVFPQFAERFLDNAYRLSGASRLQSAKPPKILQPSQVDDPSPFLDGTPFARLLDTPLALGIPQSVRAAHHWIVAGSGAGKTTALQYLIAKDLERAVREECAIVVLDSQRQLIEQLWSLKLFAPDGPLDGKLCLLDAADLEYPLAVNLFDMQLDRTASLSLLEREKLTNSALEMYDFIIGSLLQAEMTARQSTLFRFVTRALFAIPGATIHTFHDLLQNGPKAYQHHIDTLDETTRRFFATDFASAQFKQTKEQVTARLWSILGNRTFMRMFSSPRSKIDLFAEINTPGKVILINAEKGLLKEDGTELFGRFFLALINQAAAQRSSLPVGQRLPTYVYVDECHNYIRNDPKIQVILAEARQQNIGVILAHQYLGQIDPPVLRALSANTSIKMAARLEGGDRAAMSRDMNTTPEFIRDQQVGTFATYIRGVTDTAVSMQFPAGALRRFAPMTAGEREIVRRRIRDTYANRLDDIERTGQVGPSPAPPPPSEEAAAAPAETPTSSASQHRRRDPDSA